MKKIVDRITLTGANEKTEPHDLLAISEEFPFVEWGILLSKANMGSAPRFPGRKWLRKLACAEYMRPMLLSGHLCGRWVRDVCKGKWTFLDDLGELAKMFGRVQLNFHAEVHKLDHQQFVGAFRTTGGAHWAIPYAEGCQFIFQLDDVNDSILDVAKAGGVDAAPLFDLSGGAGVLPERWPVARGYCGYAGGLSPENVAEQLALIERAAGDGPIWIDVETHVRSENDRIFDLDKVRAFIQNALPWVIGQ